MKRKSANVFSDPYAVALDTLAQNHLRTFLLAYATQLFIVFLDIRAGP